MNLDSAYRVVSLKAEDADEIHILIAKRLKEVLDSLPLSVVWVGIYAPGHFLRCWEVYRTMENGETIATVKAVEVEERAGRATLVSEGLEDFLSY